MGRAIRAASSVSHPAWCHPLRLNPVLLAGPVLALGVLLPPAPRTLLAVVAIIVLGVPHGALDGEIARGLLKPRFRRSWFALFAAPYLLLSAAVLLAWQVAPIATLAAFLAASVWHFGAEDSNGGDVNGIVAHGGLAIAMSVLTHPAATARLFGVVSQTTMTRPPEWLWIGSLIWLGAATVWVVERLRADEDRLLVGPALLCCLFIVLPPLTAFAIYFVCVHAPAHTRALIADRRRAPRISGWGRSIMLSLPVTALTLLIGVALWPLYGGPVDERLLCLTIQGLAALTLPHMLFESWVDRMIR